MHRLQKFASVRASVHNHVPTERHLQNRVHYKLSSAAALPEWRGQFAAQGAASLPLRRLVRICLTAPFRSPSTDGFDLLTTSQSRAWIGALVSDFYSGPTPRFGLGNVLVFELLTGTLESVPRAFRRRLGQARGATVRGTGGLRGGDPRRRIGEAGAERGHLQRGLQRRPSDRRLG